MEIERREYVIDDLYITVRAIDKGPDNLEVQIATDQSREIPSKYHSYIFLKTNLKRYWGFWDERNFRYLFVHKTFKEIEAELDNLVYQIIEKTQKPVETLGLYHPRDEVQLMTIAFYPDVEPVELPPTEKTYRSGKETYGYSFQPIETESKKASSCQESFVREKDLIKEVKPIDYKDLIKRRVII